MFDFLKRQHVWLTVAFAAAVALVAILLMPSIDTAGPASLSAAGLLMSLMRFAAGIAAVFVVLRVLDAVADFNWPEMSNAIEAHAMAAALYLGLRFVAVAWIASSCFS